jgi:hypothetical protein
MNEEQAIENLLKIWEKKTDKQFEEGINWYPKARDFAIILSASSTVVNVNLVKACGVIAALSPRNKWEDNKADALRVLHELHEGKDITKTKLSSPHPKIDNVIRILNGVHPTKTLGQKGRSFFNCIYNPLVDDVCVDSWAARACGYTEKWISREDYPILQNYYREAAKAVGMGFTPALFQAIIWVTYRGSAN